MGVQRQRKNLTKPQRRRFQFESLEARQMLSGNPVVIPIVSGTTYSFRDAEGTTVKVKLTGAGSGQMTLTNGLKTGGAIDALTITGTKATSQLKITAAGGADDGSTINRLTVGQAPVSTQILQQLTLSGIDVASGGQLQFNGNVGNASIGDLGSLAVINVAGQLGSFTAATLQANSVLDVSGAIASASVDNLNAGSEITATQLGKITVSGMANGAVIDVGVGGIQSAFFTNLLSSNVFTAGDIGNVIIQEASTSSALAANRDPGSDGVFDTLDDFTINASSGGKIASVAIKGAVNSGDSKKLKLIATKGIDSVTVPPGEPLPNVTKQAKSQFIALEIAQAAALATGVDDDEIWIAVYGEEIKIPTPGSTTPSPITYFLDSASLNSAGASGQPTPIPISTATLSVGLDTPDQAILPSSSILAWQNAASQWGSNLQLPVPREGYQFTGRILISVGAPVQAQVVASNGTVSAPSASSLTDPSNGTFYDFLEFTVTNNGGAANLDIDTSQVDGFGLPMTLQFFQDKTATTPLDVSFTGSTTNNSPLITVTQGFLGLYVGQVVVGPGIPAGALIVAVDSAASTITLNLSATATAAGAALVVRNGGPVGIDGTRQEILDKSDPNSLLHFLKHQLDVEKHEGARPFLQTAAPFEIAGGVPITGAIQLVNGPLKIITDSTAGLKHGDQVRISGVIGALQANGLFAISNITANSFELSSVAASSPYLSGGEWSLAIIGASNPGANQPIVITATNIGTLKNGDLVEVSGVVGNTNANGFYFVTNVVPSANGNNATFTLEGSTGDGGAYVSGGTWRIYDTGPRIVSPKDVVEAIPNSAAVPSASSTNQLNNYFNEAIDAFFLKHLPVGQYNAKNEQGGGVKFKLYSNASGENRLYEGHVRSLGVESNYVLYLENPSYKNPFVIFYPFTTSNTPTDYTPHFNSVAPQSWLKNTGESASQMLFACDGFFADNLARAQKAGITDPTWSAVLGDLENSIASAFNRGIALNDPSTWGERHTWFQQTNGQPGDGQKGKYNYWVEYWHNSGVAVDDLAYAYPYDDKYGSSTNLNDNGVALARVLLNSWHTTQATTTTTITHVTANPQQQGSIKLTAQVGPPANGQPLLGTITFFIDGVAINQNDSSSSPPLQPIPVDPTTGYATIRATLPALSDGSTTHTYTLTAVYSGDQYTAPSVAYQPLKLSGPNGDFSLRATPSQAPLGTQNVKVSATLIGSTFNGTVALSIAHSDGTGSRLLSTSNVSSANWSTEVTIPPHLLTFTGDVTLHSNRIENVSSVVNLVPKQTITNAYFASTPQIISFQNPGLTLSLPAVKSGTVRFKSNGVEFTAVATEGQAALTGLETLAGLSDNNADVTQETGNSDLLQPNTKVIGFVPGWVDVAGAATATVTATTSISNGAGTTFPMTAVFTPESGGPYTAYLNFAGPPLPH